MLRRPVTALAFACALASAAPAYAQPVDQKSEAIKHFEEGVKLRDHGDCGGAIKEFLEVLRHDESVGAWLNLGACYDATYAYRKAVDAYETAATLAKKRADERSSDAKEAAKRIRDRHPWILLFVGRDVASLEGLEIRVDDIPVPKDDYGGEIFRSRGGRHTVLVTTRDREATYTANDRETVEVKLDALHPKGTTDHVAPPPPPEPESTPVSWQKVIGGSLVVGAIVPTALGVYFIIDYFHDRSGLEDQLSTYQKKQLQQGVPGPGSCSFYVANGVSDDATHKRTECVAIKSNYDFNEHLAAVRIPLAFVGAALMLGGGIALWVTAPSGKTSEPSSSKVDVHFTPTLGGGMFVGRF